MEPYHSSQPHRRKKCPVAYNAYEVQELIRSCTCLAAIALPARSLAWLGHHREDDFLHVRDISSYHLWWSGERERGE